MTTLDPKREKWAREIVEQDRATGRSAGLLGELLDEVDRLREERDEIRSRQIIASQNDKTEQRREIERRAVMVADGATPALFGGPGPRQAAVTAHYILTGKSQ